jgi:DNA-binding Lrp family transcriptional regulator
MDDTDRKLMLLMYEDPRMAVKELAKRLGISRQAVNHRMHVMAEIGVFKSFKAAISNYYLGGVPVAIWGKSDAMPLREALDDLAKSEFTTRATVAGGNHLFVFGYLRNISELSGYVEFVKKAAWMPEPTVGLPCYGDGINPACYDGGQSRKESYRKLSALDLKIIASLRDNARKPVADIADHIGVSAKTVRRHIESMKRDGSLDFDSPWDIPEGEDMITMIYVTLRKNAEKVKSARRLLRIDPVHFMYLRSFGNLPDFLVGLISSQKMAQVREILGKIEADEDVVAVTPNLIYYERGYLAWDYRLPDAYKPAK